MQIEKRKLTEIKPYDKNPRKNDSAVDAVAKIMGCSRGNIFSIRNRISYKELV